MSIAFSRAWLERFDFGLRLRAWALLLLVGPTLLQALLVTRLVFAAFTTLLWAGLHGFSPGFGAGFAGTFPIHVGARPLAEVQFAGRDPDGAAVFALGSA